MAETNTVSLGIILAKLGPSSNSNLRAAIEAWIKHYADKYGITTPARVSAFLAQASQETDGFQSLKEYATGNEYEGRKDLGNIYEGDGARYKGRGIFQVTGRSNYVNYSRAMFGDTRLINQPELLEQPQYAVLSAMIYWKDHNLNAKADTGDFKGITRAINGGTTNLTERERLWAIAKSMIAINPVAFISDLLGQKKNNPFASLGDAAASLYNTVQYFVTGN